MTKTILITGSTDGIGREAAKKLAAEGHRVILHGRSQAKLDDTVNNLKSLGGAADVAGYCCDLSNLNAVKQLAETLTGDVEAIDVVINNAGVLKTPDPRSVEGPDVRFVVNTLAPYLLSRLLLPVCSQDGRVINLSSAAQAPVDLDALVNFHSMDDMTAYSQSKLAITMWSAALATELGLAGPMMVSVNPGSLLATNMVREGFGIPGNDINIGADILVWLALSDDPEISTGKFYDNDAGHFGDPHADALNGDKNAQLVAVIDGFLRQRGLL